MVARVDPIGNWQVIGHTWAVQGLARSLAEDRAAHAYLITGPHGIGKTTLARALAQALECTGPNPPCGACRACQSIARNRHPDVQIIEGVPPRYNFDKDPPPPPRATDRERRTLRIAQIRELGHSISRAPFEGRWKIAILRRFEEAEDEAANALLKTLEEPPAHARLILTALDAGLVLPTITSRCQVLALRPVPPAEIESALVEKWHVDQARARLLAHLSAGRIGWAIRASADPGLLEARARSLDTLDAVLAEGRAERLSRAGELTKDKNAEKLPELLEEWTGWWRDVLLVRSGDLARATNVDREERLREDAARFSLDQVEGTLQALRSTGQYLNQNANTRLALEVLLLGLPYAR